MLLRPLVLGLLVVAIPAGAFAQGAITGSVKDPTGAVLPGVHVETASTVLIAKRTAVTDRQGHYRVDNLPPGTYSVTFTLGGWMPVERRDVELSGSFTATVDAELRMGTMSEAITVTGESLSVDTHTAKRELSL